MIAQHRTILYAGNSLEERENLRCFLEKNSESSYQFVEVRTGQEAIERCRTADFDCLLLDFHLPDFNADDLLMKIERQFCANSFAIVVLSDSEAVSDAVLSLKHGAHDYLIRGKTTTLELERAIENAIEKVTLHRREKGDEQEAFRLAAIVESSGNAIISKTFDGTILTWNRGAENLFGYAAEEIIGQNIRMLFPTELLLEENAIIERVRRGERINDYETVRLDKDGEMISVSLTFSPIEDSAGNIVAISKTVRNVRNRKAVEEKLRESEERYRLMFESNPLPMWVMSYESLHFLAANDAATKAYGYSRAEFLALDVRDIRPPEEVPTFLNVVAEFKKQVSDLKKDGTEKPFVMRHSRKDGSAIDVEVIAHVIIFDGKLAILIMANDITERLRAEVALKEASHFNEQIITNVQEGIIVLDKDLRFVVWNNFLEDLTGVFSADLVGKTLSEVSSIEFEENVYESLQRALNGETIRAFDDEIKILSRGEASWVSMSFSPHYTANSEIGGVIVTISDIGERKEYEQEIIRFNESLENKVAERTAELNAVNQELESFSYSVSHDLRAPLRAMDGFSLALLEDYAGKLDETGQSYLHRIRSASQEMARLIDDILLLSRITRSEIVKKDVNLSETARSIAGKLQETQPRGNVEFEIEPDIYANGDARLLKVALENLLGNAYKFTAKNEQTKIIFGQKQNGSDVEYFIKDNGAGFDMAYADKLFGAFQRLHSRVEFEGTGIGLATVQRVIRKHGGNIRAEGEVGAGAGFYFTI